MKTFLLTLCLVVAVSATNDAFNRQLLRALANFGRSFHSNHTQSGNGGNASAPVHNSTDHSQNSTEEKIPPMTLKEFQHTLNGWHNISETFINKVRNVKPLAYQALAGHKDWKEVEVLTEDISNFGNILYHRVLIEALIAGHRLFLNAAGFGRAGRCRQMHDLANGFNAKDQLAGIKSTEALISDLDCLSGELEDTVGDLNIPCADKDHFGVDKALGIVGRVMQTLYQFRVDGIAFAEAGGEIKRKFEEAHPSNSTGNASASRNISTVLKRLLSGLMRD